MRFVPLAVAASLAVGVLTAAPAAAAGGDVDVQVNGSGKRHLLVDDARGRVYTTVERTHGVEVRDLATGTYVTRLLTDDAQGLALSADGATLYVAEPGRNAIVAFDTATLTQSARYDTGAGTCPRELAADGPLLWFGYACDLSGGIGVVDLSGPAPAVSIDVVAAPFGGAPQLAVAAGQPKRMVAGATGPGSDALLHSFVVDGSALDLVASRDLGSGLTDIALTPDGARVVTATYSERSHHAFAVADLSPAGSFLTGTRAAIAVAVAPNGLVAAGLDNSTTGADVRIFRPDGTFVRGYTLDLPYANIALQPGSLAFTADSERLVAVTHAGGGPHWLQVRDGTSKEVPRIVVAKPTGTPVVRSAFTFGGTITTPSGIPAGEALRVTRKSTYGTVALPYVTSRAGGTFSVTDTVPKRGAYTYTVAYAGDEAREGATGAVTFTVKGLVAPLSVTTDKTTYQHPASTATVTVRFGTTAGRQVRLTARPAATSTETLVKEGLVSSAGPMTARYTLKRSTNLVAYFAGDDVYEPRRVERRARLRPILTQRVSGHYATSGTYRIYRTAVDPALTAALTPAVPWGCARFEAQVYRSGAWRALSTNTCIRFDYYGRATGYLVGDHAVGVPYRIRASTYDDALAAVTGAWQYLRFTA